MHMQIIITASKAAATTFACHKNLFCQLVIFVLIYKQLPYHSQISKAFSHLSLNAVFLSALHVAKNYLPRF